MSRPFAMLLAVLLPLQAIAQETPPAILLRAKSLDSFQEHGKVLFEQLGLAKQVTQFDALLKGKTGPKGLAGVDPARPIGLFVDFAPDPAGALLIPITSEKAFVDLLDRLEFKVAKDKDGIYTFRLNLLLEASVKVSGDYAWITTFNRNAFRLKYDAAKVLGKAGPPLSARVRLDLLPKDAKQVAIAEFEERMQEGLKVALKTTPDRPGPKAFTTAVFNELPKRFAQLMEQGKEVALDAEFDSAQKEMKFSLRVDPLPNTDLAKMLADAERRPSAFPATAEAALVGRINLLVPTPIAQALTTLFEESFQDAEKNLTDPDRKKKAQSLLAALKPTLEAGELDAQLRVVGPSADKKLGMALAVKVKEGDKLGTLVRDMIDEARKQMAPAEQAKVLIDADTAGLMKVHRFQLPADPNNKRADDVLGDRTLSVAFGPDAMLLALGTDGLPALKDIAIAKATGTPSPIFALDIDAARLASLLVPGNAPEIQTKMFARPGDGTIRLRAEGGANLRIDLTVRTPVLQFLGQRREQKAP
jgi:hypothetical protein